MYVCIYYTDILMVVKDFFLIISPLNKYSDTEKKFIIIICITCQHIWTNHS